jgi:hypothetical protein
VPDNAISVGVEEALDCRLRLAERVPEPVGVNVTCTVVLLLGATVIGTVLVFAWNSEACVPEMPTLEITRSAVPEFWMSTGMGALVVLGSVLLNSRAKVRGLICGAVPVPVKLKECGLPLALSVMVRVALRAPSPDGVKVTLTVTLPPAGTLMGNVDGLMLNSVALAPDKVALDTVSVPLPVLVTVTVSVFDVFTGWLPKLTDAGVELKLGAVVPVPVRINACGLPLALSDIVRVALRAPSPAGVKVTLTVTLLPAGTLIGNVDGLKLNSAALAPDKAALDIVSVALPVLVTVTVSVFDVFTGWLPKLTDAGVELNLGV